MAESEDRVSEDRELVGSQTTVDAINSEFYGRIKYPWPPMLFERPTDPSVWPALLAQDLGDWSSRRLPDHPRIWVAGCGTNQALMVALRFPHARVTGTDLSAESLELCERNARQIGVENLDLQRQSIHDTAHAGAFDYIICTGVIHHNADPKSTLAKLGDALNPAGLLELMVYNRYHRTLPLAFQSAVRTLLQRDTPDLTEELPIAKKLVRGFRASNAMSAFLETQADVPDAAFADMLLQPVEHTFTIRSLERLAFACGLELLTSCVDAFSRSEGHIDWSIELGDEDLQARYDALPDTLRWHVTNLLLGEASPWLWFYLQRRDSPRPRRTERQISDGFLDTTFVRNDATQEVWTASGDGRYELSPRPMPLTRGKPRDGDASRVYEGLDGSRPLRHTFRALGIPTEFRRVHAVRIRLATSGYPFLRSKDL